MYKAGKIAVWFGVFLTALGILVGFPLMFLDHDDLAMMFLTAVPWGFLFLFSGLVGTLLGGKPGQR
jgi:hypothetical protein